MAGANTEKNLANAHELFNNYLDSVFVQPREGWVQTRLGDIAAFKNGLNFTKGSKGEIIKIVGVKDFQQNFYVPTSQLETAQIDGRLSADYELRVGDILTVRSNGNKQLIGRCILASEVPEKTFSFRLYYQNSHCLKGTISGISGSFSEIEGVSRDAH